MNSSAFETVHENLLPLADQVGSVVGSLVAIGALLYVASKVWPAIAKNEPIDIYPLFRPFVIGLICVNFSSLVISPVQWALSPLRNYTESITRVDTSIGGRNAKIRNIKNQFMKQRNELKEKINDLEKDITVEKPKTRWFMNLVGNVMEISGAILSNSANEAAGAAILAKTEMEYKAGMELYNEAQREVGRKAGLSESELDVLIDVSNAEDTTWIGRIGRGIAEGFGNLISRLLNMVFALMVYVFYLLRIVFLCVLNVLGPIAFAISMFPGFHNNIVNWLSKYISIYLWAPIVNLIIYIVDQVSMMFFTIPEISNHLTASSLSWVTVIVQLIGIACLFAVPTISSWIVQGGEDGRAMRGFSSIGGFVGAYAGGGAGKGANAIGSKIPFVNKFLKK